MESYLTQVTNTSHRMTLTKLRLDDHKLEIECGRHIRPKINRENRTCKLCSKLNKQTPIEDEVHFITRCDNFMQIKKINPIAYGGGGFLSHTTIVLAATLKPLKLWLLNFVTSCFFLFATI